MVALLVTVLAALPVRAASVMAPQGGGHDACMAAMTHSGAPTGQAFDTIASTTGHCSDVQCDHCGACSPAAVSAGPPLPVTAGTPAFNARTPRLIFASPTPPYRPPRG